jgi:hypothetical protein
MEVPQIVQARVELQFDVACDVVPILLSICIPMDHIIVSADIAEARFLMIRVGILGPISSAILRFLLRYITKTRVFITRARKNILAKQRPEQNLPADSQSTMVMPQRNEHPNAVRLMTTAPLMDWSKGWPKTNVIWSRLAAQATGSATSTATTVTSTANNFSKAIVTTATTTPSV